MHRSEMGFNSLLASARALRRLAFQDPVGEGLYRAIQLLALIRLQPVRQDPKQEMTGQVSGCLPPDHGVPIGPKLTALGKAHRHRFQ